MYACMYVCVFNGRGSSANFVVCYLKIDKTVSSVYVTYLKRHRLYFMSNKGYWVKVINSLVNIVFQLGI